MSRIGRKPIAVPEAVTVELGPGRIAVKGPKGELQQNLSPDMKVEEADGTVTVQRPTNRGEHRALHGLTRSLIANMVEGVTNGFEKRLEIQGVGYRAQLKGRKLELALGYSHPVSSRHPMESTSRCRSRPRSSCGNRQAAGRAGRGGHPQAPPARALQGQGHPLPERAGPAKGGQARMTVVTNRERRLRRRRRVRARVVGTAEKPRLSVYRSNRGIFAELIDDTDGRTLAATNWIEPDLRKLTASEQAKRAGELLASDKGAGVETCVFDRGGYKYHGRVRALAEGAREGGLSF